MQRMQIVPAVLVLVGCSGVVDGEAPRRVGEELVVEQGGSCVAVEEAPHIEIRYRAPAVPKQPRRALLMITGALASAAAYDAPIEGFNCLERAANAGYDAYAVSYEGSGASSYPDDGSTLNPTRLLQDAATALESVRSSTGVARVDLLGSSIGSLLAMQLGSDGSPIPASHVGGLVLTGVVYGTAPPIAVPPVRAAVSGACTLPGYVTTDADAYAPLLTMAPPEVAGWARASLPGTYAVGPLLAISRLSSFDPSLARAPALQIWGDHDPFMSATDVATFQSRYGGRIMLAVVPGGGHVPYYESGAGGVWSAIFDFLDFVHAMEDGAACDAGAQVSGEAEGDR